ncbi:MAG: serine hydrolase domain-containing protein [Polyangiaceae bacterium]
MISALARALFVALLVGLCARPGQAQAPPSPDAHTLDTYARDWAERAGMSASWRLMRGESEVLADGSRGFLRGGSGERIGPDTLFWIGSISKQFAAVASLKLVEQGKLELSAPVTRYLPELEPKVVSKDGVTCTIEHLLSHRCGLAGDLKGPFDTLGVLSKPEVSQQVLADVNELELAFTPGTGYAYSNLGYDLIGLIVQHASGQSYESFLEQTFFEPLGMTRTGLTLPRQESLARGLLGAIGTWVDAATWLRFDVAAPGEMGPSGNLYSTPADLLRWTYALHHGRVLQPATYAELIRPRSDDYALGLIVKKDIFGQMIWHNGALLPHGYSSQLIYLPDHDVSMAVLSNLAQTSAQTQPFASALLRRMTGKPERPAGEPSVMRVTWDSTFFLAFVLVPLGLLVSFALFAWRRKQLDAQSWWLRYHANALLLAGLGFIYGVDLHTPLLWFWALLVLAGACKSRWWTLPMWQRRAGWRVNAMLGLRALWFLLLIMFIKPPVLWAFGVVIAGEALVIVAMAYRAAKNRSQAIPAG